MNRGPMAAVVPGASDHADTTRLGAAIGRLVPALEAFNRFQGPDPAARNRDRLATSRLIVAGLSFGGVALIGQ